MGAAVVSWAAPARAMRENENGGSQGATAVVAKSVAPPASPAAVRTHFIFGGTGEKAFRTYPLAGAWPA